jgi:hypothetical protein
MDAFMHTLSELQHVCWCITAMFCELGVRFVFLQHTVVNVKIRGDPQKDWTPISFPFFLVVAAVANWTDRPNHLFEPRRTHVGPDRT